MVYGNRSILLGGFPRVHDGGGGGGKDEDAGGKGGGVRAIF